MAKSPVIPDVPANTPKELRPLLQAVVNALRLRFGQTSNTLDQVVTYRDLINNELLEAIPSGGVQLASGISGAVAILVGRDPLEYASPPVPRNATAAAIFDTVVVSVQGYEPTAVAATEVFRSQTNDVATSVLHGTTDSLVYYDETVVEGQTYYYWVRTKIVVGGTTYTSPFHAASGLAVTVQVSTATLEAALQASVDLDWLTTAVQTEINKIPQLEQDVVTLQGLTANDVYVQDTKPLPGVGTVPDPIDMNSRWYDSNDNNSAYLWNYDSLRNSNIGWFPVTGTGHFQAEHPSGGSPPGIVEPDAVVQFDGTNETTLTRVADDTTALSAGEWSWQTSGPFAPTIIIRLSDDSDPDSLATNYLRGYRWLSLADPRVGDHASRITALEGDVNDPTTGLSATYTATQTLDGLVTTLNDTVTALSTDVTALDAAINDPTTGNSALASALDSLDVRVVANEDAVTAQAGSITTLQSSIDDLEVRGTTNLMPSAIASGGTYTGIGAHETSVLTLADVGLAPGDVISFGTDAKSDTGADRATLTFEFRDSGGSPVGSSISTPDVESPTFQETKLENATIPANATQALIYFRNRDGTEDASFRYARLNIGKTLLPYQPVAYPAESGTANAAAISSLQTVTSTQGGEITAISSRVDVVEASASGANLVAPYGDAERYDVGSQQATEWVRSTSPFSGVPCDVVADAPADTTLTRSIETNVRDAYCDEKSGRAVPGQILAVSGWLKTLGSSNGAVIGCRFKNAAGAVINWSGAISLTGGQDWTYVEGQVTVPAGAATYTPWFQINGPQPGTLNPVRMADIRFSYSVSASVTEAIDARVTVTEDGLTDVEARHGVRLNANGYVTGFIQNNDGQQGTFDILADQFRVVDPANNGQNPVVPFAVINGSVYIAAAFIRDGSITNAKIDNLNASKVNAGTLSTSRLKLDNITLTADGSGNLIISNGGVDTTQLKARSVSDTFIDSRTSNGSSTAFADFVPINVGGFTLVSGAEIVVSYTLITDGESSGPPAITIKVRRFRLVGGSWQLDATILDIDASLNQDFISGQVRDSISTTGFYYYDVQVNVTKNKTWYAGTSLMMTQLKR